MLLDGRRFNDGWGADGFCAWGGSDDSPHPVRVVDHVVVARNRLLTQYSDKPNMVALVTALASAVQQLEDAGQGALQLRGLEGALSGLDALGGLLGLARDGLEDNTYRALLAGAAVASRSDGTPETVRRCVEETLWGLQSVRLRLDPPGATVLVTFEIPQLDGDLRAMLANRACPAGTRVVLEWELPTYLGPSVGWESDNSGAPWAEWGGDPSAAGLWAEASDGGNL